MSDGEIGVLEWVNKSINACYHELYCKDIPVSVFSLISLHQSGHLEEYEDYYFLTEKGQAALESNYLDQRIKGL